MNSTIVDQVREIVLKEDERYSLTRFRLIDSREELIFNLCDNITQLDIWEDIPFHKFKSHVIGLLYSFIHFDKQTLKDEKNTDWMFFIYKRILKRFREKSQIELTIDLEIGTLPRTIAFKDSRLLLLAEILSEEKIENLIFTPEKIENYLLDECSSQYPICIHKLSKQLFIKDEDFWSEISIVLYNISEQISSYYSHRVRNKHDMQSEVWQKSNDLVRELIFTKKNPVFGSGLHFKNYLRTVSSNVSKNYLRKEWREQELNIPLDENLEKTMIFMENSTIDETSVELYDIDKDNIDEVQQALVKVLIKGAGTIYETIIHGIEDKVETLLFKTVESMSYADIVEKMVGNNFSEEEKKKMEIKLRQDVTRVKKTLKERFYQLLNQKER